jgi:hypothetical protein
MIVNSYCEQIEEVMQYADKAFREKLKFTITDPQVQASLIAVYVQAYFMLETAKGGGRPVKE